LPQHGLPAQIRQRRSETCTPGAWRAPVFASPARVERGGVGVRGGGSWPKTPTPSLTFFAATLPAASRGKGNRGGRYCAAHIPGARYIEFPGPGHLPWVGNADTVVDHIEEFITGSVASVEPDRVLATVMFVDMVDSTRKASALGDKAWRELLDRYQAALGRQTTRARGRIIKSTGDGLLATFDGPARAVRCGFAMRQAVVEMNLSIKIGLHTGEIELKGDDIGGIAR
jgi:hypothetical protein